jgi:hypothetical protein
MCCENLAGHLERAEHEPEKNVSLVDADGIEWSAREFRPTFHARDNSSVTALIF